MHCFCVLYFYLQRRAIFHHWIWHLLNPTSLAPCSPMNKLLCSPHSSTTLLLLWGPLSTAMYDILLNSTSLARLLLHEPAVVLSTLHHHISDLMRSTFNHHYSILLNSTSWSSCSSMNQPECSPLSITTLLMLWGSLSTTIIASFRTPQVCPTATPWTSHSAPYSPLPLFWSFEGHFSPPCITSLWTPQVCPPASPWTSHSALHSPPPIFWSR